jgi:hypothetical protein
MEEQDDSRLLRDVLAKHGRPKKGEEKGCITTLKRGTAEHWLLRLDRADRKDLVMAARSDQPQDLARGVL